MWFNIISVSKTEIFLINTVNSAKRSELTTNISKIRRILVVK